MSLSTIVVALDAQLLRRIDLRLDPIDSDGLVSRPGPLHDDSSP